MVQDEFTIDKVFGSYNGIYMKEDVKKAFNEYTGDAYIKMNRAARSGKIATFVTSFILSEDEKTRGLTRTEKRQDTSTKVGYLNAIRGYFKDSKPFIPLSRMILYRKIKTGAIKELINKGTLVDLSFTSTTMSAYIGANVSTVEEGYTVRLHMLPNIPYKLFPIKYFSSSKSEEEVLFDSNMKYYLCNPTHKMQIGDSNETCSDVLDCIFIPKEFEYLLEANKNEWFNRWSRIINDENKYIFTDILPIKCYHRYDQAIFHFINEIEYFIQKSIWENKEYTKDEPLIVNPYQTIRPFAETLISEYMKRFFTTNNFISGYRGIISDTIIMRCIEFAENKAKKFEFGYTFSWNAFISKNIRVKSGGSGGAALHILADLNTLLKSVEGAQCVGTAGLKKEIRLSIRNVKALVGAQKP